MGTYKEIGDYQIVGRELRHPDATMLLEHTEVRKLYCHHTKSNRKEGVWFSRFFQSTKAAETFALQKMRKNKRFRNFHLLRKHTKDLESAELQKEVTKDPDCEAYQIHVFGQDGNEKGPQGEVVYWPVPKQCAAICFGGGHPVWISPSACVENAVEDFFNLPD